MPLRSRVNLSLVLLQVCILSGCSVEKPDYFELVDQGDLKSIKELLDSNAESLFGARNSNDTAVLPYAIWRDRTAVASLLIERAPYINGKRQGSNDVSYVGQPAGSLRLG